MHNSRFLSSSFFAPHQPLPAPPPPCPYHMLRETNNLFPPIPTGIRNFKHKLFARQRRELNSENRDAADLVEMPRAPTSQMVEVQLLYTMARPHESSVMLALQMDSMRKIVEAELASLSGHRGLALTASAITYFFKICEYFKVSDHVRFAALELYDRFMTCYNERMRNEFIRFDSEMAELVVARVKEQSVLRMTSCIQLASKVHADNTREPIRCSQVFVYLEKVEYHYSMKAINQSELRVLEVVKHKLNCLTSLDVAENILIQLELSVPTYRKMYEFCARLLDYIYVNHDEVYNYMFKLLKLRKPKSHRSEFRKKIEYNKLNEASGLVACCIHCFKPSEYKIYVHAISSVTKSDEHIFTDLAAILVKGVTEAPRLKRVHNKVFQTQAQHLR